MALRWGLLSTARINGAILGAARATKHAEVVAVASRERARAERYAREHGIPRAHAGYDALLEDPEVDAVYVSVPNALHVPWAIRALEAGKHVLCEKPLSRRPQDVERAFDAADRQGLVLSEGFMWRHHPQGRALAAALADGVVGQVRLVRAAFGFDLTVDYDARWRPELDGGSLMDVGCYCVSGIRLAAAGEPEAVRAEQVLAPSGVDVRMAAVLRFPGGVLAQLDCGFDVAANHHLEVVGDSGSLFVADPWHCRRPRIELRRPGPRTQRLRVGGADPYRCELDEVAAAVRERRTPLVGRGDALGQARTIDALYRSAATGETVGLAAVSRPLPAAR